MRSSAPTPSPSVAGSPLAASSSAARGLSRRWPVSTSTASHRSPRSPLTACASAANEVASADSTASVRPRSRNAPAIRAGIVLAISPTRSCGDAPSRSVTRARSSRAARAAAGRACPPNRAGTSRSRSRAYRAASIRRALAYWRSRPRQVPAMTSVRSVPSGRPVYPASVRHCRAASSMRTCMRVIDVRCTGGMPKRATSTSTSSRLAVEGGPAGSSHSRRQKSPAPRASG
ncbi:hypothetical protein LUX39_17240 [Actinomadura madurae]|nr:hypothetical protein [Actinomadura madurae]MCQ0015259.1 hypothetical protein [Actinomadura madurae]